VAVVAIIVVKFGHDFLPKQGDNVLFCPFSHHDNINPKVWGIEGKKILEVSNKSVQ
jgi:hypothetical protein